MSHGGNINSFESKLYQSICRYCEHEMKTERHDDVKFRIVRDGVVCKRCGSLNRQNWTEEQYKAVRCRYEGVET